jgi:regulator of replication initiation timing
MEANPEKVIADLLNQNAQLRFEAAVLRATLQEAAEIEQKMKQSQNFPPEALEVLSKLDIR